MKKVLTTTALAALAATAANAAIIKLDFSASNTIVTSDFTAGAPATTYLEIDVSAADGTADDVDGVVDGVLTLGGGNEYILDGITFVENGVLKIEPGTIIRGELQSGPDVQDAGTLVITRTARIDAQGTADSPIIFTTAAVDDVAPFGEADGLTITVLAPDTDDWFAVKSGTQWTPGATFLDADPVNNPLPPTVSFATDPAPSAPFFIVDALPLPSGNGNPDTASSYVETIAENRSLWGGVIISGNAPTNNARWDDVNKVISATISGDLLSDVLDDVYEGFHEGLDIAEVGERAVYGGNNPNDCSGVMRFVSIRHGGASIGGAASGGNEINGLTMGAVGRGTLIENIEVYCNGDDGFEWFGGTVDTKYLISLYNNDDSFDIDEGFTGRGQFWFGLQLDDTVNGNHGGEHDGTDARHDSINNADVFGSVAGSSTGDDNGGGITLTYITVYNATFIGGGTDGNGFTDSGDNNAFRIRDSFGGTYRNSIFTDHKDFIFRIDSDNAGRNALGDVNFENNLFYGAAGPFASVTDLYSTGIDEYGVVANGNEFTVDAFATRRNGLPPIIAPKFDRRGLFNGAPGLDPRPSASQASSNLAAYCPTFFTPVGYKGAFAPGATPNTIWTGSTLSVSNPAWNVTAQRVIDLQ